MSVRSRSKWNLKRWFLRTGENRSTRRKTSRSKGENQQQTQPTYGVDARIRTRATLVGGRCSMQYATLASPKNTVGTLRSDDGDGNGNATKAIGLISKTIILHLHHAFLYISLPSLHDYAVKMPNFTMYRGSYRGSTQATTKFPFSF